MLFIYVKNIKPMRTDEFIHVHDASNTKTKSNKSNEKCVFGKREEESLERNGCISLRLFSSRASNGLWK